jgi:hypothetical protein
MKRISFLTVILLFSWLINLAQAKYSEPYVVEADSSSCEIKSLHFDIVAGLSKNEKKKVFVIFRAGKKETETINNRRLAYVRDYLRADKNWEKINAIYARGDKSNDSAKIEFYLGGDLLFTTLTRRNMTPCMNCCGINYYYPQNILKPKTFKSVKDKEMSKNN